MKELELNERLIKRLTAILDAYYDREETKSDDDSKTLKYVIEAMEEYYNAVEWYKQ